MVLVSIICVSYNDLNHLKMLFESLERQSFQNFEVILVDNAKNALVHRHIETLQARKKRRIVYIPNANEGYPGGNVTGVRSAKGDYVMIINPDTTLEADAIERLIIDFLHKPDDVMVLVPKILIRQTNTLNSIGMKRIRPTENIYTNIGYLERDVGQYDAPRKVEAFDGSAFMFRKNLLRYTHLFDPRYFFGNETVDLAERMAKLGFSAYTCPAAVVRHELRGTVTSPRQNDRITAIIVRNSLIHTLLNTDPSMFLRTLIVGICIRNVLGRIVTGRSPRTGVLYLRGVVMFLTQLGKFTAKAYPTNHTA